MQASLPPAVPHPLPTPQITPAAMVRISELSLFPLQLVSCLHSRGLGRESCVEWPGLPVRLEGEELSCPCCMQPIGICGAPRVQKLDCPILIDSTFKAEYSGLRDI